MSKFWIVRIASIVAALAGCFIFQTVATNLGNDYYLRLFLLAGLYVTLSVSLNLINGITGQFSIGHAAFYMIGAYSAGILTRAFYERQPFGPELWLVLMMLAGGVFAAIAGLLVGLPSLRLKGDYLAIVTLGFGEIIRIIATNQQSVGGSYGFSFGPKVVAPWMVCLLAVITIALCRNLLKSAHGLPFLAVREDEIAASAMGVNVTKTKVAAFVLGSALAGAAGAILALNEGYLNPDIFKMDVSFLILTMVVLGGTGSITGSALAAIFLFLTIEIPRNIQTADGQKVQITLASLLVTGLAIAIAVSLLRKVKDHFHGPPKSRLIRNFSVVIGSIGGTVALSMILNATTVMGDTKFEFDKLRMVILSIMLLVVMLLRPQGVLAHHEFSWDFVKRLFSKKSNDKAEVAS